MTLSLSQAPQPETRSRRWAWMDNLRVAVIAGVIVVHVGLTYAVDFSWYYEERTAHTATKAVLSMVFGPAFLFGMAVLFFVAGITAHRSLARNGAARFVRDRLVRIALPLAVIVVVLDPVSQFMGSRAEGDPTADDAVGFLVDQARGAHAGHGWFIAALLLFSAAHAAWRQWRPAQSGGRRLGRGQVTTAWAALAVGSFIVRLAWPLGESTPYALNLWEWPQMATLYALGVLASERHWLDPMPEGLRRSAGRAAAAGVGGAVLLSAVLFASDDADPYLGGLDARGLFLPAIEATLSIAMSFWLVDWFAHRWNQAGPLAQALGRASFAAYVIHLPIAVGLSVAIRTVGVPAEVKFVAVSAVALAASFGLAWAGVVHRRGHVA